MKEGFRQRLNGIGRICKIIAVISSGLVSLVFLSGFCLLYNNTGTKCIDETGATGAKWEGRQFVSNMIEGFSWFITDANGYNNQDVPDAVDVLFMGDSHFEAVQILQSQNVSALLHEYTGLDTYSIGVSGKSLESCVKSIDYALEEYSPRKYIVFDSSNLAMDLESMQDTVVSERAYADVKFSSGPMFCIKQVPCVKPMLYQVQRWVELDADRESGIAEESQPDEMIPLEEYTQALYGMLAVLHERADNHHVTPVILYHPTETLCGDGTVKYGVGDEKYRNIFEKGCEKNSILFVDLTDAFKEMYAGEYRLAHGFVNTATGNGHLNRYGHRLAAEKLAGIVGNNK